MKIISAVFILMISSLFSWGQCIPDTSITHNVPGIYPDSITGLPHAVAGHAYGEVIQLNVRPDTMIGSFYAIIDSAVIDSVSGLPPTFGYTCTPANCSFPGGSNACIYIYGQPTVQMYGVHPLVVHSTFYGSISGIPQSVLDHNNDYSIVIDTTTGIATLDRLNFSAGQNMPNPAKEYTVIPVNLMHAEEVTLTVSNVIGKKVFSRIYNLQKGKSNISLDLHGIQSGIYIYTFTNGVFSVTRRMIISND